MTSPSGRRFRLPGFFWRFYIYGVLLLCLVAVAGAVVAMHVGELPSWASSPERLGRLVERWVLTPDQSAGLPDRLRTLRETFDADVALYTEGGRLLSGAGQRVPPPLSEGELKRVRSGQMLFRRRAVIPVRLPEGGNGYLVVSWDHHTGLLRLVALLAIVLPLLTVMPWVLARLFARPLERIATAAQALGDGNLDARTGIRRSDEIGTVARSFDEMAGRLQSLVRHERELLANVSHELRTPITRIRLTLELCAGEWRDQDKVRTRLDGISADVAELENLVETVLAAARLDPALGGQTGAGQPVCREAVEPGALLAAAAERFARLHGGRRLEMTVPEALPRLSADPALIGRLLDNLLDNAAKYSEAETVVELAAESAGDSLVIMVRDRGLGIPPADLERVFDPFYRSERSRDRSSGGIGLGLTLCRRVAAAHGGAIVALLREGGGTEIRLSLPLPDPAN